MEPMNQMPPNPMPPPSPMQPMENKHVCGAGCWHSIICIVLILALAAGGVWWYINEYQAPSSLHIEENKAPSAAVDEDAVLQAELEAENFDSLGQESADLEAELSQ